MNHVNLIPAARRAKQLARRRRQMWIRWLRAYAVILAIACGLAFLPAQAAAPSLESSIARVDRRIETRTKELDAIRRQSAAVCKRLDLARVVGEHPDWSLLLHTIARSRADLAVLESLDFSIAKEEKKDKPGAPTASQVAPRDIITLKLLGIADSPKACITFASALEKLNLFDRVSIKDTHAQTLGHMNATHFEIEATLAITPAIPAPKPEGAAP